MGKVMKDDLKDYYDDDIYKANFMGNFQDKNMILLMGMMMNWLGMSFDINFCVFILVMLTGQLALIYEHQLLVNHYS